MGAPEGLLASGLLDLSAGRLEAAAATFAEVRAQHPEAPQASDAAFWLAEVARQRGSPRETLAFLRLVRGSRAQEASWRLVWLLDASGRSEEARALAEAVSRGDDRILAGDAQGWLGLRALLRGDVNEARTRLRAAIESSPPQRAEPRVPLLFPLAVALRDGGDLAGAEQALLRLLLALPDHPTIPRARLTLGYVLLEVHKPREAGHHFAWLLDASPPPELAERARYGRLRALLDAGEAEKAAVACRELGEGPWATRARVDLAWAAHGQGAYGRALTWLEGAPAEAGGALSLGTYLKAQCLARLGRSEEARTTFARVPKDSPLWPAALHGAAVAALEADSPSQAQDLLEELLRLDPEYSGRDAAWLALGRARLALGQTEPARRAFEAVAEGSPAYPDALYRRGWIALQGRRWDEATALLTRLLRDHPDDGNRGNALLALARAEFNRRSVTPALAVLDQLETSGASASSKSAGRFSRAYMLARSGESAKARGLLDASLAEEPRGPYAARAQNTLAWLDLQKGDCTAALPRLEAVIALAPGGDLEREALGKKADCLYEMNRFAEALAAYRSLPDDPGARYGEGLALAKLGRLDELEQAAGALAPAEPGSPEARRAAELFRALAQGRATAGLPAAAAAASARAAALFGPSDEATRANLEGGRWLLTAGDPSRAEASLESAAAGSGAAVAEALEELARLWEASARPADASRAWDRLAERSEGARQSRALRAAARLVSALGDVGGAADRLRRAADAAPAGDLELRRALQADLGELFLKAGRPADALEPLQRAGAGGLGPEGLRALGLLARAQKAAGRTEEALETCLRIGYLYPPVDPATAQALLEAAAALAEAQHRDQARGVYRTVAREGPEPWAGQARQRLEALSSIPGT
ncbi:MAG: tetratricopeptide repeat protein [Deltaproteobacteria bacterium]|nr:tetratricopeptide repeat protein [Deltaproteobacteria bacterium]